MVIDSKDICPAAFGTKKKKKQIKTEWLFGCLGGQLLGDVHYNVIK